jgi:transposase
MTDVITIGVDLAKNVFQVHGVDAEGGVVFRRQLRRGQILPFFKKQRPCLVGMEACATSHHWGRELRALGHQVRLMPPRYVKPYVKRNKNDMADAEAICEAVTRPTMRFVEIKTPEQQSVLMLHRIRRAKQAGYTRRPWLTKLLDRRSTKIAAIALANKIARTAWAMMAHGTCYQEHKPQAT